MKKVMNRALVIALLFLIGLQFFQLPLNNDQGRTYTTDFTQTYRMPVEVNTILKTSCYDCHSNNTNYRWYDYVQPGRWLVEGHIRNAKKELNFNEWGTYPARKQERLLRAMEEQVETGQMPLRSYTLLHRDAALSKAQIEALKKWLNEQT